MFKRVIVGKIFIVAEKKEVGIQIVCSLQSKDWEKEIKTVKGGYYEDSKYISSWAMGHLFTQKKPSEINESWGLFHVLDSVDAYKMQEMSGFLDKLKTPSSDKFKKNQIQVLKKLFERNDIDKIIICTDADAEGEAIGRDILTLNKNSKTPVFRLWNSGSFKSKDSVDDSFSKILPINDKKYEFLFAQQKARSGSDYLLGMKITKNLTELYGNILETGRLKGLLISILAKKELDIKNFIPKPYWKVAGIIKKGATLKFPHFYKNEDNEEGSLIYTKEQVDSLLDICKKHSNTGIVDLNETKETISKERPLPLSGTDFANEMMKKFKISLDECNKILAFLREEGLTSYQGTNGRYFSKNDKEEVLMCINVGKEYFKSEPLIKSLNFDITSSIFNDKKAEKQNHTPLTVRAKIPNDSMFKELESKSKLPFLKESYELILKRVICNFLEEDLLLKQKVIISIDGNKFKLEGSKAIKQGWRELVGMEISDNTFDASSISIGSKIIFDSITTEEDLTTTPKLYTVQKLVNMMLNVSKEINALINESTDKDAKKELEEIKKTLKNAEGIGTDRTRPTIIKDLEEFGFFSTHGKEKEISLLKKGWEYFDVLPSALKSFKLCAEWETSLQDIRNGDLTYKEFIKQVDEMLYSMIEELHKGKKVVVSKRDNSSYGSEKKEGASSGFKKRDDDELVETPKTFRLGDNFVFKTIFGKNLTKSEAKKILLGEVVVLDRVSKEGKKYSPKVALSSSKDGKVDMLKN